jgi:multidrug transporter EmrE-like cation transporter
MGINWNILGYGVGFGLMDALSLPVVKAVSIGANPLWMILPTVLYASIPSLFLIALQHETLTIMNLVWDLTSDLVVTTIGLIGFGEKISPTKALGIVFSFCGLALMSYESHTVDEFLSRNYRAVRETLTLK